MTAPPSDAKVPLYDTNRGWPERRVPLSLAEIEELIALIGDPDAEPDETVLAQLERKLTFHRGGFIADLTENSPREFDDGRSTNNV